MVLQVSTVKKCRNHRWHVIKLLKNTVMLLKIKTNGVLRRCHLTHGRKGFSPTKPKIKPTICFGMLFLKLFTLLRTMTPKKRGKIITQISRKEPHISMIKSSTTFIIRVQTVPILRLGLFLKVIGAVVVKLPLAVISLTQIYPLRKCLFHLKKALQRVKLFPQNLFRGKVRLLTSSILLSKTVKP